MGIKMKRGVGMCGIGKSIAVVKCETVAGATDPPMTTAIPCVDKWSNCQALASKYCYQEKIGQGCRKACGLCPGMTPASSYTCQDKYTNCQQFGDRCYSKRIRSACPRTCGQCPGQTPARSVTCYNRYRSCNRYASYCSTNRNVKDGCRITCNSPHCAQSG